jgi:FixJ family two-component response regulator
MPKLLGTDLIREMRALRPDLPAILTSGYGLDAGGRDAALFPPGVVFLRKPAARADLVSAVRRLLGNRGR